MSRFRHVKKYMYLVKVVDSVVVTVCPRLSSDAVREERASSTNSEIQNDIKLLKQRKEREKKGKQKGGKGKKYLDIYSC